MQYNYPKALYIHIPWCIKKCPYCDFNSHKADSIPEEIYIKALIKDFKNDLIFFPCQDIDSIFIGGGTPSLISAKGYELLFTELLKLVNFCPQIEITLEANPGTVEQKRFSAYRSLGINRLSLGIQSFDAKQLKSLGRIHNELEAKKAILAARKAGFDNLNLDLMYALPQQTLAAALFDLGTAISYDPQHISWYQLTLEPNTIFYKKPPILPDEDLSIEIEQHGLGLLRRSGYQRYEISAYCLDKFKAKHNLNYWLYGDYFGIGAGAHGKISQSIPHEIFRTRKVKQPKEYLSSDKPYLIEKNKLDRSNLIFEFMLNTTRLEQQITMDLFIKQTGLNFEDIDPLLKIAAAKDLISYNQLCWQVTELGRRFTNDLQSMFLLS